jgi:hypothetical protein
MCTGSRFALFDSATARYVGRDGRPTSVEHEALSFDDPAAAQTYADRFACEPRLTPVRLADRAA